MRDLPQRRGGAEGGRCAAKRQGTGDRGQGVSRELRAGRGPGRCGEMRDLPQRRGGAEGGGYAAKCRGRGGASRGAGARQRREEGLSRRHGGAAARPKAGESGRCAAVCGFAASLVRSRGGASRRGIRAAHDAARPRSCMTDQGPRTAAPAAKTKDAFLGWPGKASRIFIICLADPSRDIVPPTPPQPQRGCVRHGQAAAGTVWAGGCCQPPR